MNFDTVHNLTDLRQTYPNPPHELFCGTNLIHHAYGFGEILVVMEAVKECLVIAREKADTGAVAHLSKHIKDFASFKQQQEALEMTEKGRAAKNTTLPIAVGGKKKK